MRKIKGRIVAIVALSLMLMAAVAIAKVSKHSHHGGHDLVGAKLKKDGTHQIDKNGKHTVHAEVKNGKIAKIHVKHESKGEIAVKKYKSKKKMASLEGQESPTQPADQVDMGTVYIAYAYEDDAGVEHYYWFPYEEILDGDTGAIDYVPLS